MTFLSPNHYWRITAAGLSYVVFGLGAFLPGIYVFTLAIVPMKANEKQRRARQAIQSLCRFYVGFMRFLGLLNYDFSDLPSSILDKGAARGYLVISNHTMLVDALFMLAYVPNLCCVVKSALCTNPFTRIPIRLAGYISNNHENLVEEACAKLHAGENILVFPEGTRNQYDTQLEFRRGAANIAVMANAMILPVVIVCQPRALQKGQAWYDIPEVKSLVTINFLEPLNIADCIDTSLSRPQQYRRLTEWLREFYLNEVTQIIPPAGAAL